MGCVGDAHVMFDSIDIGVPKFLDCDPIEIPDKDDLQQNFVSSYLSDE